MKVRRRDLRNLTEVAARRGVRLIAFDMLQDAEKAFTRLTQGTNAEALHDFRVALRRLRSHMRIYRPWLRESVRKKDERRLRRAARASNASRDLEVLIEQLEQLDKPSELEQTGIDQLLPRFKEDLEKSRAKYRSKVVHEFPPLARRLKVCLSTYSTPLGLDGDHEELLGPLAARMSAAVRANLRTNLAEVLSIEHQNEAHEVRILGKRLRYLFEPFSRESRECNEVVIAARRSQDVLGQLHDAHILLHQVERALHRAETGQQPALAALHERVSQNRARWFERARQELLDSQGGMLIDLVKNAERAVAERSGRGVQRKFLLRKTPRLRQAVQSVITQGYLPGREIRERVRAIECGDGRKYYRTLEAGDGSNRLEFEEETTETVFKRLFSLTRGQRVRKRRYTIHVDGVKWEIDRFLDRKLVLAEVNLPSEDTRVELPRWLKTVVEREVTGEMEFSNVELAR